MEKYITRDRLADFVEKMWDAGIMCELKPKQNYLVVWSDDFDKKDFVSIVDKKSYDGLVDEIKREFLPIDDGSHTMNTEG